jgi:hypothetical protein
LKVDPEDKTKMVHKGIRSYLEERGLFRAENKTMYLACHDLPPLYEGPTCQEGQQAVLKRMLLPEARALLASQPDFERQRTKNWITETVERHGCISIFGAKFHPELAPIEYFYTRAHCDYTLEGLRETLPHALASVSLCEIRRQYEHVWRYMKAYSTELSLSQVEWAMRKYTLHRRVKLLNPHLDAEFLSDKFFEDMPKDIN